MFTFDKQKRPIAIEGKGKQSRLIYLVDDFSPEKELKGSFNSYDGAAMEYMPNPDWVEKIYISAPSGAGKSYWAGSYLKKWKKKNKDKEIYLFSTVDEDEVYDKVGPSRVILDEELLSDPLEAEDMANSIVIFDDTDTIADDALNKEILKLRDSVLEIGRHHDIRALITSHITSDYRRTRRVLNEATGIVLFPKGGGNNQNVRYLKGNLGLPAEKIKKIMGLSSRWVYINIHYPQFVVSETKIFAL